MKVMITIQCDNAAFEESASAEVTRILRDLADHLAGQVMADLNEPYDRKFGLRDSNGNTVGQMVVTDE